VSSFNAWRVGARHYVSGLGAAGGCAYLAASVNAWLWPLAGAFLAYGLFALFFFRDPPRRIAAEPYEAVSPADGKVVGIEDLAETPHYDGPCVRLSIFLSILDAHVNRSPCDGAVQDIQYKPGKFKTAMKAESSECNEANTLRLKTPHGPLTVRQIAGIVARRIVCVTRVGETLAKGQKFGMIKFGSRTELYLPAGTQICVKIKDRVRAGTTVVAKFT